MSEESQQDFMTEDYAFADDELLKETQSDFALADIGQGWHRIGKLNLALGRFLRWENRQPVSITIEEWKKTPANQRGFDFIFNVNISEFDQKARDEGWAYERRISFKSRDWYNIFVPSVEEVFGKDSMNAKGYMTTMSKLRGQYVDLLDVPQSPDKNGKIPTNETTGKPYTTCKLIKVFDNREVALEAFSMLKPDSEVSKNHYPAIWSKDGDYVSDYLTHGAEKLQEGEAISEIAGELKLTGEGAKTSDGEDIDAPAIWQEILETVNVPPPLKADLEKKINDFLAA